MTMSSREEDEERFRIYEQVHLRSKEDLTQTEKIEELNRKLRNKSIHFILNISIVVLFAFMFLNGMTTFSDWFYYVLFGVFLLNMILIYLQRRQIRELIIHYSRS